MIETNVVNLEINELTQEQYKSAKKSGTLNSDAFYMTSSSESLIIPISQGGTNAQTAQEARTNLGFEYGTENPTHIPTTGDGAIYFKIDSEDDGVLPIEEGGTGAITGHEALVNLGAIDYVVEQGTSGIWTYRKWNSGIAECWGHYSTTETNYTTFSPFYGYYGYCYFPENFFIAPPNIQYAGKSGSGFTIAALGGRQDSKDFSVWYLLSSQSGSTSIDIDIQAKGRWK